MNSNVLIKGDVGMIDFPTMLGGTKPIIPRGWYLLDNQIEFINVLYKKDKPIIVLAKVDIAHYENNDEMIMSVIKTDKDLEVGDTLSYK